jgi:hypothetical protein
MPRFDLTDLDRDITKEKIKTAVMQLPPEKAPSPDGYIGAFNKKCWHTVKDDVVRAIQDLFALRVNRWNLLNSANITLIAKKDGAQRIVDFRLITVMHSIAKLLGKIIANRLAPRLDQLVSYG